MSTTACAAAVGEGDKPWRLSASVVVLAPYSSVPTCELSAVAPAQDSVGSFDYRVCCLKRAAKASFMPDAMVFPGGAVDINDKPSAIELLDSDSVDATLHCAAVREVFEESGIGIFEPPLSLPSVELQAWRKRVHADASQLRSLCSACKAKPSARYLHHWCSFITPDFEHSRLKKGGFDARFYVWCASEHDVLHARADQEETVQLVWLTPAEALAAVYAGSITMVPPQWYILKELAERCPRMADVPAYAASDVRTLQRDYPIKPYPVALQKEEQEAMLKRHGKSDDSPVFSLCYPGDEAHPVFPGKPNSRHRMLMIGKLGGHLLYELQRDESIAVPLKEAMPKWYSLAKL